MHETPLYGGACPAAGNLMLHLCLILGRGLRGQRICMAIVISLTISIGVHAVKAMQQGYPVGRNWTPPAPARC